MMQVSWTNFTPSSALIYNASNTYYPVMLAECDSASPASPADCYAAEAGGVTSVSGPDGPDNTAYGTTGPDGTGLADIHILTGVDNPFLGCAKSHACSLVIVPAQGGNIAKTPADCADHSTDAGFGGTALGNIDFGSSPNDYLCSWAQRIVVPLNFAPSPKRLPAAERLVQRRWLPHAGPGHGVLDHGAVPGIARVLRQLHPVGRRAPGAPGTPVGGNGCGADHPHRRRPGDQPGDEALPVRSGGCVGGLGRLLVRQPAHRAAAERRRTRPAAAAQAAHPVLRLRERRLPDQPATADRLR